MSSNSQIYLITGANRGIGLGLVKELALNSANTVVVAGVRDPSKAVELKKLADSYPGRIDIVKYVSADVEGNKIMAKEIQDKYGKVDVVVGNAGIGNWVGPALETPPEKVDEHIKVNVTGNLVLFQATYSLLKASKNPKFVPITSLAGSTGHFASTLMGMGCYGASKAALNYITRNIQFENEWLIAFPLAPGVVVTDMANETRAMDRTGQMAALQDSVKVTPDVAAKTIISLIENATREKEGGKFINVDGTELPW